MPLIVSELVINGGHLRTSKYILYVLFTISRLRVCCIITSEMKKCCLKYKSRGSYISNYEQANKNIILILQSVKYKVDFHPLRESNVCLHVIGSASTSRSSIICTFIFCLCMPEIIYTRLYTILAIISYHQISIIGFLSRKINPEFK
jgi:hypothetical protein